jgi:hypothetical protein
MPSHAQSAAQTGDADYLAYVKFLGLVDRVRLAPDFPALDHLEVRLLNGLVLALPQKTTVLQAMKMFEDVSTTTAHRRLKALSRKGFVVFNMDEQDNRVKYVAPTALTGRYFSLLGLCLKDAVGS